MSIFSMRHKAVWILLILKPNQTPEVRSFAYKNDAEDNLTDYLSEIGLDGEGNSLDTYARPIERCVRESSYSGKDGTQCYLYESEVE